MYLLIEKERRKKPNNTTSKNVSQNTKENQNHNSPFRSNNTEFSISFFLSNTSTSSIKLDKLTLNLLQVIGSSDPTCVFSGFRSTTPHPQLPSSICPFYRWTDIGPLHHPWDTCGGEPKSGPSLWSCWPGLELPCGSFRFWAGTKSWGKDQVIYQVIITWILVII